MTDLANSALAGTPPKEGSGTVQGWTLLFHPIPVSDGFRDLASLGSE